MAKCVIEECGKECGQEAPHRCYRCHQPICEDHTTYVYRGQDEMALCDDCHTDYQLKD